MSVWQQSKNNRAGTQLALPRLAAERRCEATTVLPERLKGTSPGAPNPPQHLAYPIHTQGLPFLSPQPRLTHTHTHTHTLKITAGSALRNRQTAGLPSSGSGCAGKRSVLVFTRKTVAAPWRQRLRSGSPNPLPSPKFTGSSPARPPREDTSPAPPGALCSRTNQMRHFPPPRPRPGRQKLGELPRPTCLLPKAEASRDDLLSRCKWGERLTFAPKAQGWGSWGPNCGVRGGRRGEQE